MIELTIVQLIIGALGTGGVVAVVNGFFNRRKSKADAEDIITGIYQDLNKDLLAQLKEAQLDLRNARDEVRKYETLISERNIRIKALEDRVDSLEEELAKYKKVEDAIDSVKETLHQTVESAAEQIKTNIKNETPIQ